MLNRKYLYMYTNAYIKYALAYPNIYPAFPTFDRLHLIHSPSPPSLHHSNSQERTFISLHSPYPTPQKSISTRPRPLHPTNHNRNNRQWPQTQSQPTTTTTTTLPHRSILGILSHNRIIRLGIRSHAPRTRWRQSVRIGV